MAPPHLRAARAAAAGASPPLNPLLNLAHLRIDHDAVERGHGHITNTFSSSPLPSPSKNLRRPHYFSYYFCRNQQQSKPRRFVTIALCLISVVLVLSVLFVFALPAVTGSSAGSGGNSHLSTHLQQHQHQRHRSLSQILSRRFVAEIDERTGTANIQPQTQADEDDDDNIVRKMSTQPQSSSVVFATRIHLGHAKTPPTPQDLRSTVSSFLSWAASCGAQRAAIAVDPAPKIEGYDLVKAVEEARDAYYAEESQSDGPLVCDVVPVTPWGKFVPALNALVGWAATTTMPGGSVGASRILFASAETSVTPSSVKILIDAVDDDTLVAGCALPGHDYKESGGEVPLTGRTTPWNTCAVWNLGKLATTGFPLVAEGLHVQEDGTPGPAGVEEASTIAILQRTMPRGTAVAKLVRVPGVKWEVNWDDEGRRRWHESKMRSKVERAAVHLKTLGLEGTVLHV